MTRFKYRKDNGDTSEREVVPIGFRFGEERDTVLCIDVSEFNDEQKETLEKYRQLFLDDLYDEGFGSNIRSFHYDSIEEILE